MTTLYFAARPAPMGLAAIAVNQRADEIVKLVIETIIR